MAEAIKLTERKFVYNGIPYWRRKAESMLPGTWGRKKTRSARRPTCKTKAGSRPRN